MPADQSAPAEHVAAEPVPLAQVRVEVVGDPRTLDETAAHGEVAPTK